MKYLYTNTLEDTDWTNQEAEGLIGRSELLMLNHFREKYTYEEWMDKHS